MAPADAAVTGLGKGTVDLFFSIAVFEHVPVAGVQAILREARRVLKPGGLTCHHIGLHDHFANFDSSISVLNFLKFGDTAWKMLGQNKIQYHNRLRASDFERLFAECGFTIISADRKVAPMPEMRVAPRFSSYAREDLATYCLTVCARKSSVDA
jgi:SAM-dependent methyltransferase